MKKSGGGGIIYYESKKTILIVSLILILLFNCIFATADFLNNPQNPPIVDGLLS